MNKSKKVLISVILMGIIAIIAVIWLIDYHRVKSLKKPLFCLKNQRITYIDGYVDKCIGFGYKVYHYNRGSMPKALEFGPLYIKINDK